MHHALAFPLGAGRVALAVSGPGGGLKVNVAGLSTPGSGVVSGT